MPSAVLLAPLIVAGVLVASAVPKAQRPKDTWSAMRLLKVPAPFLSERTARALPWGELVVAAAVLLAPSGSPAVLAAAAATVLMLAYWALVARALTFEHPPSCGCFGRIGQHQITPRTLLRNTLLLGVAVVWLVAAWRGNSVPGLVAQIDGNGWWWLLGALVAVAVAVLVVAPGRDPQPAPLFPPGSSGEEEVEEDYVRLPIPLRTLQRTDGSAVTLHELVAQRPRLLVFTTCSCGSTAAAADRVPAWRERLPIVEVSVVSTRSRDQSVADLPGLADDLLLDHGSVVFQGLAMGGSPSAVLLGADGLLAGGPVAGLAEVEALVDEIAEILEEAELPHPPPDTVLGEVEPTPADH